MSAKTVGAAVVCWLENGFCAAGVAIAEPVAKVAAKALPATKDKERVFIANLQKTRIHQASSGRIFCPLWSIADGFHPAHDLIACQPPDHTTGPCGLLPIGAFMGSKLIANAVLLMLPRHRTG